MKKLLAILILVAGMLRAQQIDLASSIWLITPTVVCPGDSIKVDYKWSYGGSDLPQYTVTMVADFWFTSPTATTTAWHGTFYQFRHMPKEYTIAYIPPGQGAPSQDTTNYIYLKIPFTMPEGIYQVLGNTQSGSAPHASAQHFTVYATPTVTAADGTICSGESFSISPAGATNYTYSGGQVVTPEANTIYTITGAANGCTNTATVDLQVSQCTGLNSFSKNSEFKLYPNPAENGFCFLGGLQGVNTISIYNTLGEIIFNQLTGAEKFTIDLTDQPAGTYLVKIIGNNSVSNVRLIR